LRALGLSLLLVISATAVFWFFASFVPGRRQEAIDGWIRDLDVRAEIRKVALERYFVDGLEDAQTLAAYPTALQVLDARSSSPGRPAAGAGVPAAHLKELFGNFVRIHAALGVVLWDAEGKPRVKSRDLVLDAGCAAPAREALALGAPAAGLHLHEAFGSILTFSAPVRSATGEVHGAVVVAVDPRVWLYPLLAQPLAGTSTGEALIVGRDGADVVYLSPLRERPDAPLRFRRPLDEPGFAARAALEGSLIVGPYVDYRGVRVLAGGRRIPSSPWALVVKIDEDEALAVFRKDVLQRAVTWGALLVALLAAAVGLWRWLEVTNEAKLARSEAQSRALMQDVLDHGAALVYIVDMEGRFLLGNRVLESVLGVPREKILGRTREAFMPEHIAAEHRKNDLEVIGCRQSLALEETNEEPDGQHVYSTVKFPLLDAEGTVYAVAGMSTDITERRRAEDRILHLNRLLRTISEINQIIVHVDEREMLLAEACRVLVEHGGFRMAWVGFVDPESSRVVPEARAGDRLSYLDGIEIRSDDMPQGRGPAGTAIRTGKHVVVPNLETDTSVAPWRERMLENGFRAVGSFPLKVRGEITGVLTVYQSDLVPFGAEEVSLLDELAADLGYALEVLEIRDENRSAEEALRRAEERFRIAAEASNDVIYEWDLKDGLEWYGDVDGLLGYGAGEFPRTLKGWTESVHPEDLGRVRAAIEAQLEGRAAYAVEYRMLRKDGAVRWWSARGAVARGPDGTNDRWVGTITDITDRKLAEMALSLLAATVESSEDAIIAKDLNGIVVSWNPGAERLLGYRADEMIGSSIERIVPPDRRTEESRVLDHVRRGDRVKHFDTVRMRRDGSLVDVSLAVSPVKNTDGRVVGSSKVMRDITERKRAEEALRTSQERLLLSQRAAGLGNFSWDIERNVNEWSDEIMELYGLPPGGFGGKHESWRERIFPDDLAAADAAIERSLVDGDFKVDFRIVRPDGGIRWLHSRAKVFFSPDGRPLRMVGVNMDITDRKRAEEEVRKLNAELEERVVQRTAQIEAANKELEAFSYSVSHDLRSPLRAIDGFSRILLSDHAEQLDAEGKRLLGVVRTNTRQMGQLIDDLLAFSRVGRQSMARTAVDMASLAKAASDDQRVAGEAVSITVGPLPPADADPSLMRQVWVNLISNALKFSRPRAEGVIAVEGRTEQDRVVYSVKDNGVGFDMAYANKLFGVFQRLHASAEFEGTGVGLALVQRIVHRHGGEVWAEGKVGEGATFSFSLPRPGGSS
jgi:PAS domain S-box-containing protein